MLISGLPFGMGCQAYAQEIASEAVINTDETDSEDASGRLADGTAAAAETAVEATAEEVTDAGTEKSSEAVTEGLDDSETAASDTETTEPVTEAEFIEAAATVAESETEAATEAVAGTETAAESGTEAAGTEASEETEAETTVLLQGLVTENGYTCYYVDGVAQTGWQTVGNLPIIFIRARRALYRRVPRRRGWLRLAVIAIIFHPPV